MRTPFIVFAKPVPLSPSPPHLRHRPLCNKSSLLPLLPTMTPPSSRSPFSTQEPGSCLRIWFSPRHSPFTVLHWVILKLRRQSPYNLHSVALWGCIIWTLAKLSISFPASLPISSATLGAYVPLSGMPFPMVPWPTPCFLCSGLHSNVLTSKRRSLTSLNKGIQLYLYLCLFQKVYPLRWSPYLAVVFFVIFLDLYFIIHFYFILGNV